MTQKRKAELQRKLSIAPVPRPPNGLADRIKKDIPDLLDVQRERTRFSRTIIMSAGVAASVLLLFSSAFFTLELLSPDEAMSPPAARMKGAAPSVAAPTTVTTMADAVHTESRDQIAAATPVAQRRQAPPSVQTRQAGRLEREAGYVTAAAPPPPAPATDLFSNSAQPPIVASAEGAAPAAPVAPPAPLPAEPDAVAVTGAVAETSSVAESTVVDEPKSARLAAASMPGARFKASDSANMKLEDTKALFSFSIDAQAFDRVKGAIERGEKPAPDIVDVSALVNYFAGAGTSSREVGLDVEASRGPLPEAEASSFVRFSVDTKAGDATRAPEGPPVATNLFLLIEPNPAAVADYRLVGGAKSLGLAQSVLMRNASVTGVMEVDLKPNVSRNTVVVTFRLRYRSVATGRTEMVVGRVRAHELTENWLRASRRHRLATLGAVWGETLRGTSAGADVARTAEELAKKEPDDNRARELAAAATASYRLRISGSTGSGR